MTEIQIADVHLRHYPQISTLLVSLVAGEFDRAFEPSARRLHFSVAFGEGPDAIYGIPRQTIEARLVEEGQSG